MYRGQMLQVRGMYRRHTIQVKGMYRGQTSYLRVMYKEQIEITLMMDNGHYITLFAEQLTRTFEVLVGICL